jgi:hypothetical protein
MMERAVDALETLILEGPPEGHEPFPSGSEDRLKGKPDGSHLTAMIAGRFLGFIPKAIHFFQRLRFPASGPAAEAFPPLLENAR